MKAPPFPELWNMWLHLFAKCYILCRSVGCAPVMALGVAGAGHDGAGRGDVRDREHATDVPGENCRCS
ncbi:hypothetical protein GUJ93_ZPchr0005g16181 [Zizania palustris]|uniref:Uncharacterized protein n=1 Tax=Zizania palustris TaxID=103762 RepID=A0A8J5VH65_ZIZPA|nr:hypothetical protein GUJ93_ZPchr0005g16181 [Zizania palustris]